MSRRAVPPPARLFLSVIYREEGRFEEARRRIAERVAPLERASEIFAFDRTDYYEREMGRPLFRRFLVGDGETPRDALPAVKVAAEAIELELSEGGRRTVNIDPGLLSEENVVLATGKNYGHRVYLGDGVFADLTLVYGRKEGYRPLPWTYPDYASAAVRAFLEEARASLREARRRGRECRPCG